MKMTKMQMTTNETVLSIDSLDVEYSTPEGAVRAVRDVSLNITRGETHGIAGESGSGKSTLALAILQYLGENGSITNGTIQFNGTNLQNLSEEKLRSLRGNDIAHVAQDAKSSLNPSLSIGEQVSETIRAHQDVSRSEAREQAIQMLQEVDIPDPEYNADQYPHELSGGQQQRVLIAMALSCSPELLILDEPTTGLDVTTQSKIIELIQDLKDEYETTIVLITHNLEIIAQIADRVSIMYAGELMEQGDVHSVFDEPSNPYTQGLLAATPEIGSDKTPTAIPGQIPDLTDLGDGCIFADRCDFATEECRSGSIEMERVSDDHNTRCRRWKTAVEDPIRPNQGTYEKSSAGQELLSASGLKKNFDEPSTVGALFEGTSFERFFDLEPPVKAVNDVDITIHESETVGLVGESGSGKSTLGRTLLGLLESTDGTVRFKGDDISSFDSSEMREFYSECQIVFQNPHSSLNPRKTIGEILERPLKLFTDKDEGTRSERVIELLEQVDLGSEYASRYPHELSGGEKQRVAIARAFAPNPSLIVLDEPVSALDVSVQANILDLLSDLRDKYGTTYLLISHDLSVINVICDRIMVMYLGEIIESGTRDDIFAPPYHPYTRALLSSIPNLDPYEESDPILLEGDVPSMRNTPSGCSFHTRCPQKIGSVCENSCPQLEETNDNSTDEHRISCHLDEEEMSAPITSLQHNSDE